jgi:hypothetical protein
MLDDASMTFDAFLEFLRFYEVDNDNTYADT